METWGKRCDKLLIFTTIEAKDNNTIGAVVLPVKEGKDVLWDKAAAAFTYTYEYHLNDGDWFFKADDDT